MERPRAWFELDDPSLRPSKKTEKIITAETDTYSEASEQKPWGQVVEENGQHVTRQWTDADLGI